MELSALKARLDAQKKEQDKKIFRLVVALSDTPKEYTSKAGETRFMYTFATLGQSPILVKVSHTKKGTVELLGVYDIEGIGFESRAKGFAMLSDEISIHKGGTL